MNIRFIFLFRWTEERRARRKVVENAAEIFVKDEEKVNSIFFAQQVGELTESSAICLVKFNNIYRSFFMQFQIVVQHMPCYRCY